MEFPEGTPMVISGTPNNPAHDFRYSWEDNQLECHRCGVVFLTDDWLNPCAFAETHKAS